MLPGILAGVQALSQYQGSRQEASSYQAQARAAEQNVRLIDAQRQQENLSTLQQKEKVSSRSRILAGEGAASAGASGIVSTTGSALTGQQAIESGRSEDIRTLNYNQIMRDYSLRVEQAQLQDQARSYQLAAKQTKKLGALNTILGLGTTLYGLYGPQGTVGSTKTGGLSKTDNIWDDLNKSGIMQTGRG